MPDAPPDDSRKPRSPVIRRLPAVARVLMGLAFLVFGLNGLFHFLPEPDVKMAEGAADFAGALMKSGYMFPLIFITQALVGAMLLLNRFVPLALVLIAPFLVNSVAFHVFLEPSGLPMALVFAGLEAYLAISYRGWYRQILTARATPASAAPDPGSPVSSDSVGTP